MHQVAIGVGRDDVRNTRLPLPVIGVSDDDRHVVFGERTRRKFHRSTAVREPLIQFGTRNAIRGKEHAIAENK